MGMLWSFVRIVTISGASWTRPTSALNATGTGVLWSFLLNHLKMKSRCRSKARNAKGERSVPCPILSNGSSRSKIFTAPSDLRHMVIQAVFAVGHARLIGVNASTQTPLLLQHHGREHAVNGTCLVDRRPPKIMPKTSKPEKLGNEWNLSSI